MFLKASSRDVNLNLPPRGATRYRMARSWIQTRQVREYFKQLQVTTEWDDDSESAAWLCLSG